MSKYDEKFNKDKNKYSVSLGQLTFVPMILLTIALLLYQSLMIRNQSNQLNQLQSNQSNQLNQLQVEIKQLQAEIKQLQIEIKQSKQNAE